MHSSGTTGWSCPIPGRVGANPWALVSPAPASRFFFPFSIWTATLLILPENRGGGCTLRGSRRLPPVSICQLLRCSRGRGAQESKASPGQLGSGGLPALSCDWCWNPVQWDAPHLHLPWPANTPRLCRLAPHGCYGRWSFLLFLICWQICCYLSAGLVSESVWVTSFAS